MDSSVKGQAKQAQVWTDEDILDALWMRDEGYTFKQIGAHFGVTKNAAIGMANRVLNESKG